MPPGEKFEVHVGIKQLNRLKEILKELGGREGLYIMHSFLSDSPKIRTSGFFPRSAAAYQEDLEVARANLAPFDRELGEFLNFLKAEGLYDSAFILIAADTVYDPEFRNLRGDEEIPASAEMTRIFIALKKPDQREGRVLPAVVRQIDVLPTLLAALGIDPTQFPFEGVAVTDPTERAGLSDRPLEIVISSEVAGLLRYRLSKAGGPLRRVHP